MRLQAVSRMLLWVLLPALVGSTALPALAGTPSAIDRELAERIRMKLEGDPRLGFTEVRIDVTERRVVLRGQVRTLAARKRAGELASRVVGVLDVENKIRLDVRRRSVQQLESRVRSAFSNSTALNWSAIEPRVRGGGKVVLEGSAGDARLRFVAWRTAAEIEGVTAIIDKIETPDAPDDQILDAIEAQLQRERLARLRGRIQARVKGGAVVLTGRVPRPYDRDRATELALSINGVREVENRIVVDPPPEEAKVIRP